MIAQQNRRIAAGDELPLAERIAERTKNQYEPRYAKPATNPDLVGHVQNRIDHKRSRDQQQQ